MKISIIIPMYNCTNTIIETINSIEKQNYTNYCAILIDDGSTDDTYAKVKDKIDINKHFKLIHTKNYGVSHARNIGLKNVDEDTKIIIFVDSDDTLCDNAFDTINDNQNDYDIVCYSYIINKHIINYKNFKFTSKIDFYEKTSKKLLFNQLWNKSFSKKAIKQIYFNENLSLGEDLDFNIRCLSAAKKIRYIDIPIYNYNLYNNGLSYVKRPDIFQIKFNMLYNVRKFYIDENHSQNYINKLYQKSYLQGLIYENISNKSEMIQYNSKINKIKSLDTLKSNSLLYNIIIARLIYNDTIVLFVFSKFFNIYDFFKHMRKGDK